MIPIEALRQVRHIVVHADCADGIASAMILHDALPEAEVEVVAVQYGPEREGLEPEEGMLFCDMTPPEDKVDAFVKAGATVLDHHKGARELVSKFGELGVFADEDEEPGVSGATLAFRHVWQVIHMTARCHEDPYLKVERFAELAGIRDTWQTEDSAWDEACAQAEALMFWGLENWIGCGPYLNDDVTCHPKRCAGCRSTWPSTSLDDLITR